MDQVVLGVIILAAVALYVTRRLPLEVTSLLIPPALVIFGVLDVPAALSGFSSGATISIAGLLILSAALTRTGTLEPLVRMARRHGGRRPWRLLLLFVLIVPALSAFMNNIPVVAMLVPVLIVVSRDAELPPSKVMIPLSFLAILGGNLTLIGTGTNLLVHETFRTWEAAHDLPARGLGMFDFTAPGLVILVVGALFLWLFGNRLLPTRFSVTSLLPRERSVEYVTEALVDDASTLAGRTVKDVFPRGGDVRLLEIVRDELVILRAHADDLELLSGDVLILAGRSARITSFLARTRVSLAPVLEDDQRVPMRTLELSLAEAVVLPGSQYVGRPVVGLGLHRRHGVNVLAVQRGGRHHRRGLQNFSLHAGDVLLLQGESAGIQTLGEEEGLLLVEGLEAAVPRTERSSIALAVMVLVIGLATLTALPIAVLAIAGAAAIMATGTLRPSEAFRALQPSVLLLLAGTIPLGLAMEETKLARDVVHAALDVVGDAPNWVLLGALYLLTLGVTSVLSNKATAVLLAPIGIELALRCGADPRPFLMAICFAASSCFCTPIGYPTNLIVMGPGGYHFGDYARIGVPLNVLLWIVTVAILPVFFPF